MNHQWAHKIVGDSEHHQQRSEELCQLLDIIKPVIEQDGGRLLLDHADTNNGTITLRLQGACGSCAASANTLEHGITRILRQRLEWITTIKGTVDDDTTVGQGAWTPRHT